jgi:SAM-dependent methyltransferase
MSRRSDQQRLAAAARRRVGTDEPLKAMVKEHWERETCGTRYSGEPDRARYFSEISSERYRLEPYIFDFADFAAAAGKRVLEIGVGAGADFENWCRHADFVQGVDLTDAAIGLAFERMSLAGIPDVRYGLQVGDAEALPFPDREFDLVYSWGVLHHTPDTEAAFRETFRVLKPGGQLKAMIYHVRCWTGLMLALRRVVLRRSIRGFSMRKAIFESLESPGTKAYSLSEARTLLSGIGYTDIKLHTRLGPGDLLTIKPSDRYRGRGYQLVWKLYPRPLVRALGNRFGMNLMITARKKPDSAGTKQA